MARWGRRILFALLAVWGLLLAARCHLPRQTTRPQADQDRTSALYVVQHGWHAGIAVRRSDLPDGAWPVLDAFPDARYLEVGWGEARYYPGESRGVWGAVRAGGWPTASVLHVVPIPAAVPDAFPQNKIVRVPVGADGLAAVTAYVAASFEPVEADTAAALSEGLYPGSRFYASSLSYHVFNNCNHWAAGALEAAGCDTSPRWTLTVGQVMRQARACGTLVQRE